MQDLTDDERKQVIGEVFLDEFKAIREILEDVLAMKPDVRDIKEAVERIEQRQDVHEAMIREHETDLRELRRKAA